MTIEAVACGQKDLSMVDTGSKFSETILTLFSKIRPTRIIETGTYHGTGTTSIIASSLRDLAIDGAIFFSIEVNPSNYLIALENLTRSKLIARVRLLNGLSVPRRLLPTLHQIEDQCVHHMEFPHLYVDHLPEERAQRYFSETNWPDVPENVIGNCLAKFDFSPDFVLLDSAGSMGNIEFNYVISQLKGPCYIALDDINHVKHHKSFVQMKKDPRFQIINYSDERTGFCIARFEPFRKESKMDSDRLLAAGEQLFAQGKTLDAVQCFEDVLQRDPSHVMALNDLGVIAFQLNDLQSAETFLTKSVRLDRRNEEALANLAEVLMKQGKTARASELLGYAAEIRGDDPSLWRGSAICKRHSGDPHVPLGSFRRSYAVDGSQADVADEIRRLEEETVFVKTKPCRILPPKKILVINNIYPPQELGGYGRLMHSFASGLESRGHMVDVLTSDAPYLGEISSPEPHVVRSLRLFGRWTRKGMESMSDRGQVLSIIRENGRITREVLELIKPDVCLVGNIDLLSVLLFEPFFESSVPVLHYLANEFIGYDVGDTPRNSLYHVGAISHWLKADAIGRGYPFQNAVVIYSGAFVREFDMLLPPLRDKLRIAFAGLVNPYKGPQVLLDALLHLKRNGVDFSCSIAGGTFDEGFTGRLKEEVRNTGMGDHIAFTGWLDQKGLKDLYARHNVLVFPSMVNETFGISQVEAMAAGLAVITSGKGGAREVIEDGVSGLVFEPGDHVHLARHLMGLTRNPHQWEELAETGRRRAMEEFDIELSVDQMEATFQKMLR